MRILEGKLAPGLDILHNLRGSLFWEFCDASEELSSSLTELHCYLGRHVLEEAMLWPVQIWGRFDTDSSAQFLRAEENKANRCPKVDAVSEAHTHSLRGERLGSGGGLGLGKWGVLPMLEIDLGGVGLEYVFKPVGRVCRPSRIKFLVEERHGNRC